MNARLLTDQETEQLVSNLRLNGFRAELPLLRRLIETEDQLRAEARATAR